MMNLKQREVVILGGGGHATVVVDSLISQGRTIRGIVAPESPKVYELTSQTYIGPDQDWDTFGLEDVELAVGIGIVVGQDVRRRMIDHFGAKEVDFATVAHASAIIADQVQLGEGAQVMAGAVVQPGSQVADFAIINTRASIDHHCVVGWNTHIAPGAVLCGSARVGDNSFIGAGAVVFPGVSIGDNCVVPAGKVVSRDVLDGKRLHPNDTEL